jgi:uncharacterized repeat protein (TIGR03803 family)
MKSLLPFAVLIAIVGSFFSLSADADEIVTLTYHSSPSLSGTYTFLPTGLLSNQDLPSAPFSGTLSGTVVVDKTTLDENQNGYSDFPLYSSFQLVGTGGTNVTMYSTYQVLIGDGQGSCAGYENNICLTTSNGVITGATVSLFGQSYHSYLSALSIGTQGESENYEFGSTYGGCEDYLDSGPPGTIYTGPMISPCSVQASSSLAGTWTVTIQQTGTYATVFNFDGTDGTDPVYLIKGNNGDIYGTACEGGLYGGGTLFESIPNGTVSVVANFGGNGAGCPLTVVQAPNGTFYGTTASGGSDNDGTIFKVTSAGSLTRLFSFSGTNGSDPNSLSDGAGGLLYGTTCAGGAAGDGTVFTITTGGKLTTLADFGSYGAGCPETVLQATDGNYYGVTKNGGANNIGTLFKVTPSGTLTQFHSFTYSDGEYPSGLIQAANGTLYGVTCNGGTYNGGTLYSLTTNGTLTTIANFGNQNGTCPSSILQGADGNFYGTSGGGGNNTGSIYEATPSGVLSLISSFPANAFNSSLHAMVQGTDGVLYGATQSGGTYGDGTLYSATIGPPPSVPTVTPSLTGTLGSDGYYVTPVTVSWTVTGYPVPTTSGCGTETSGDTTGTPSTCTASNSQGSVSQTVIVKQDTVPPAVTITSPRKATSYAMNEVVKARYSCSDATSGVASCVGTVPNGTKVPTSAAGKFTFTVTGTDVAGNKTTKTVNYSVN